MQNFNFNFFLIFVLIACCLFSHAFHLSQTTTVSPFRSFPSTGRVQSRGVNLVMGNNAKFGIFSPAVYAAKFVLGDAKLNKVGLCEQYHSIY